MYRLFRFYIEVISYACFSLTSLSLTISRSIRVAANGIVVLFLWLSAFKKKKILGAVLDLSCCSQAFSICRKRELLSSWGAWASYGSGFSICRAWARGLRASAVGHELISCGLQALKCGLSSCGKRA